MYDGITNTHSANDFGARYYSSALGRFLTPDWSDAPEPIPYADLSRPQSLNLYSYVENNPVTATDPDGHLAFSSLMSQGYSGQGCGVDNADTGCGDPTSGGSGVVESNDYGAPGMPASVQLLADPDYTAIDLDKVAQYADQHANGLGHYGGKCAAACRNALQAGGLDTTGHPEDAKDYGPFLLERGAVVVSRTGYEPQKGDIAVFQGGGRDKDGHIQIYDGEQWVSDTRQPHFMPRSDYPGSYVVYRFPQGKGQQ